MNPVSLLVRRELAAFHVRMAGCGGCGEVVDALLRDGAKGRVITLECSSPRHADLIVVTGCWTADLEEAALTVIAQAPVTRRLLVVGDCALARGTVAERLKMAGGIAGHVAPDLEVAGCPVTRESILEGVRHVAG